mgnify:CR=1 FL=1
MVGCRLCFPKLNNEEKKNELQGKINETRNLSKYLPGNMSVVQDEDVVSDVHDSGPAL